MALATSLDITVHINGAFPSNSLLRSRTKIHLLKGLLYTILLARNMVSVVS